MEITNCIIQSNVGYGINLSGSNSNIVNSTIVFNGTGMYCNESDPVLMNTIFYFNTEDQIAGSSGSTITIDYSDIQNGETYGSWATGTGNIDSDPLFINSFDYHLQAESPCIDAGNPDAQYNYTDGSRNDIGAYGGPNGDW